MPSDCVKPEEHYRRVRALIAAVTETVRQHQVRYLQDGMTVYLAVEDARLLDEEFKTSGGFFPISQIQHGDTGSVMGVPFIADESVKPGRVLVGYVVDAKPKPPTLGEDQEVTVIDARSRAWRGQVSDVSDPDDQGRYRATVYFNQGPMNDE
ncbi:hypothetical protein PBI_HILLTOPFARM_76 [Mycobacterium phage Hilltopfarm]|nr:hypothetical protein PBI_HILLTOPFARM_76 [Mycobacterium phage Hilltopfarm]